MIDKNGKSENVVRSRSKRLAQFSRIELLANEKWSARNKQSIQCAGDPLRAQQNSAKAITRTATFSNTQALESQIPFDG